MADNESKYVQQHLANERTFLAWIRTMISIMGVGFITTTLHLDLSNGSHYYADLFVKFIGISTLLLSFAVVIFSAWSYVRKRHGINNNSFQSTSRFIVFLTAGMLVVLIGMTIYLVLSF